MLRPEQELVMKIAMLRRAASREFDDVVCALKEHSNRQSLQCVQSPPDQLQRLQGRAQQCVDYVALFEGADKTANRISDKANPLAGRSAAVP